MLNSTDAESSLLPSVSLPLPACPSDSTARSTSPADPGATGLPDTPSPAPSPSSGESEEEKAKKLLYCSLCKVAVNSLSQLEAHNKGNSNTALFRVPIVIGTSLYKPGIILRQIYSGTMQCGTIKMKWHYAVCTLRSNFRQPATQQEFCNFLHFKFWNVKQVLYATTYTKYC